MASLKTRQLLHNAATVKHKQESALSKEEISKKISEIKYLSEKKNVPKLSLRKEILHLEKQLQSLFNVEERLLRHKKQESTKISALKRQITGLKKKLEHATSPDIEEKIDKLTHILGELLAKADTADNVRLKKELDQVLSKEKRKWEENQSENDNNLSEELTPAKKQRALILMKKTALLRKQLEEKGTAAKKKGNKELVEKIKQDILLVEARLEALKKEYPQLVSEIDPEINEEEILKQNLEIAAMPSQISMNRSHLDATIPKAPALEQSQIKHKMMLTPPSALQSPMQNQSLEEVTQDAQQEHMDQMANQINAANQNMEMQLTQQSPIAQMGMDESQMENDINEELIAELPLPPPPKIRRR